MPDTSAPGLPRVIATSTAARREGQSAGEEHFQVQNYWLL
jgi:hypothetical protein